MMIQLASGPHLILKPLLMSTLLGCQSAEHPSLLTNSYVFDFFVGAAILSSNYFPTISQLPKTPPAQSHAELSNGDHAASSSSDQTTKSGPIKQSDDEKNQPPPRKEGDDRDNNDPSNNNSTGESDDVSLAEQLINAIHNRDAVEVQALLENGASANAKWQSQVPLHEAIQFCSAEICQLLLLYGADQHAADRLGFTPLIHATLLLYQVQKCWLSEADRKNWIRRFFMPPTADYPFPEITDEKMIDQSAQDIQLQKIVELLIDHDANLFAPYSGALTSKQLTPPYFFEDQVPLFSLFCSDLVKTEALFDKITQKFQENNWTYEGNPLQFYLAGRSDLLSDLFLEYLIDNRHLDITAKNDRGQNLLQVALDEPYLNKRNHHLVKRLVELGSDLISNDNNGECALTQMIDYGWFPAYNNLVEVLEKAITRSDLDLNSLDVKGQSLLEYIIINPQWVSRYTLTFLIASGMMIFFETDILEVLDNVKQQYELTKTVGRSNHDLNLRMSMINDIRHTQTQLCDDEIHGAYFQDILQQYKNGRNRHSSPLSPAERREYASKAADVFSREPIRVLPLL